MGPGALPGDVDVMRQPVGAAGGAWPSLTVHEAGRSTLGKVIVATAAVAPVTKSTRRCLPVVDPCPSGGTSRKEVTVWLNSRGSSGA